jgi:hypothetical protein
MARGVTRARDEMRAFAASPFASREMPGCRGWAPFSLGRPGGEGRIVATAAGSARGKRMETDRDKNGFGSEVILCLGLAAFLRGTAKRYHGDDLTERDVT